VPGLDPNAIHVINGDSAAGSLKQAISSSTRTVVSRDVLSCGPILPFADLGAWKDARVAFWRNLLVHDPQIDFRPPQNGIWENQERIRNAPRVYAWAASGNTDQFFIAFLLELVERLGSDPGRVELIEFSHFPSSERRVLQTGELDASQMRMHPEPRPLSMDDWMSYRHAWRALTSDQPQAVWSFGAESPKAPAQLRQAINHVKNRYPDRVTGLDFWDRQLLKNVRERGPRAARVVGYTMGEHFDQGDLIGDLYFFTRLLSMASAQLPRPLLTQSGDGRDLQNTNFELTDFGAQVCDGKASTSPANPIDYWAGGVHLSSATGNLWFNDAGVLSRG
jgi:hypothetical protein